MVLITWSRQLAPSRPRWAMLSNVLVVWLALTSKILCMTDDAVAALRQDTRDLFYHGYSNYMAHAFPEDELRPLSCKPQTRNREHPADIGLNDVLGNYSLTLVDSLSSLAILASSSDESDSHNALGDFQAGVKALVDLYGDGSDGSCGSRACGFDLDSKVQVFETNIRGVGGLLSAHLFAVGELPIRGYKPAWKHIEGDARTIDWGDWHYDGQLLRLARDLALRLLPAFSTDTGLPYPRVNLRTGIPFYQSTEPAVCNLDGSTSPPPEITETCSAGAGSLILEFTTLSRLTGEPLFEQLAKKAFWSVWERRSPVGLVGAGIDAETANWIVPPLSGIGAGVDSFLEYAFKGHVLLANLPDDASSLEGDTSENLLLVWQQAHAAIKRHVYRDSGTERHPFYGQSDFATGAARYSWVDNLSAYYPGLLTLAGELEEAIESHLLYAALWTRYAALPERWQVHSGHIDQHFKHWSGRPEFIESTYYLYQATKDPYYLHVGEMALRDIRRRCWTKCGWADLGDVLSGEQRDRMESFFLGETAKYLFLLFDSAHPLNHVDGPVVFTTEGHPLTIPKALRHRTTPLANHDVPGKDKQVHSHRDTCPAPLAPLPLTVSNTADRDDLFHAAAMTSLHQVPFNPARASPIQETSGHGPAISILDIQSPTNYSFYPWTLPSDLVPAKGFSSRIRSAHISTLNFPNLTPGGIDKGAIQFGALQKVLEGVVINSLSNIRLNMIEEPRLFLMQDSDGSTIEFEMGSDFRVSGIANWNLGRDEKVLLNNEALRGVSPSDPYFTKIKDLEMVDLVVDVPIADDGDTGVADSALDQVLSNGTGVMEGPLSGLLEAMAIKLLAVPNLSAVGERLQASSRTLAATPTFSRHIISAILPTGVGAAPLTPAVDNDEDPTNVALGALPVANILFMDDTLCSRQLPASISKTYAVLVLKRGGCSFSDKLANIPAIAPSPAALQLVIVLDAREADAETEATAQDDDVEDADLEPLIRPLLDQPQLTPNGFERRHPLSMLMVDGSRATAQILRRAAMAEGFFDEEGKVVIIERPAVVDEGSEDDAPPGRAGLGVKRRFWFESQGVPIKNLILL